MKILCQERYEKAVAYAKEIKNDTLQKCIDRLKQWEENSNCPCEIELYYDSAPHSFGSDRYIQMVEQELSEACSIMDSPTNRLLYC